MNTSRLAMIVATTMMLMPAAASAQTRYFARGKLPTASAATQTTPPATPKTVTCSGMVTARTVYPAESTQYIRLATSFADGLAACNEAGAQYGEALRNMNHCMVSQEREGVYYVWLNRGPTYDYVGDAKVVYTDLRATGDCTYNP